MGALDVDFTIPEPIGGVRAWFMEALRPLAGFRYREGKWVEVVLGEPTEESPHEPDVGTDIVIPASRIRAQPVPSSWLPEPFLERLDFQVMPREPVMRFRFAVLGRETYVLASCDDDLPPAQEDFLSFLKQVQARYPEAGPLWQGYAAGLRERKKERLKKGFAAMGRRRPGDPEKGGHGESETGAAAAQDAGPEPALTAALHRRRGRKLTDPAEMNKICADWLKVQDRETQTVFCNRKGISPTLLRRWLKHYPYSES